MKKLLLTLGIYSLLIFIACIIISNVWTGNLPALATLSVKPYKFARAILWFLELLPAILMSGVLLGCCIQWKSQTSAAATEKPFSEVQWGRYRKLFVFALIITLILTLVQGLFVPSLERKQEERRNEPALLEKSLGLAEKLLYEEDKPLLAVQYAEIAYKINPEDSRVVKIYKETHEKFETIRMELEEKKAEEEAAIKEEGEQAPVNESPADAAPENESLLPAEENIPPVEEAVTAAPETEVSQTEKTASENLPASKELLFPIEDIMAATDAGLLSEEIQAANGKVENLLSADGFGSKEMLEKADQAAEEGRWFDAHYWASQAVKACRKTDTNYPIAVEAANQAWSKISNPAGFGNEEQRKYYNQKRLGYTALNNGDFLRAYYIYEELAENPEHAEDPDVIRYLTLSKETLENQYFFIDEKNLMENVITDKDIYFELEKSDGCKDVFFIGQMAKIKEDGGMVRYLQDFNFAEFGEDGKPLYSYYVPFVKAVALPVSTFSEEQRNSLGISKKWKNIPQLYLYSVDRKTEGSVSQPVYEKYDKGIKIPGEKIQLLSMSFDDFDMLDSVAAGPAEMGISKLFKFCKNPCDFGFTKSTYIQSFVSRITYPLLLLTMLIFCGIMAWNYGFTREDALFKFKYLFTIPLLFFIAFVAFEVLEYAFMLLNFVLVGAVGFSALYIVLVLYFVLLVAVSLIFVSRKNLS